MSQGKKAPSFEFELPKVYIFSACMTLVAIFFNFLLRKPLKFQQYIESGQIITLQLKKVLQLPRVYTTGSLSNLPPTVQINEIEFIHFCKSRACKRSFTVFANFASTK